MNMLEIVGVFLCTLSLSEAGAVSLGGQCPDIRGIDNFNEAGYLGVWYQYSSAPEPFLLGLTCVRATYTDEGEDKVGVYNEGINNILKTCQKSGSDQPASRVYCQLRWRWDRDDAELQRGGHRLQNLRHRLQLHSTTLWDPKVRISMAVDKK